ncbi:MAG: hypothetical protein J7M19_01090 [Planctomycetes bacterium]|nr:hypothetical protein [Planctomycetota bacterium]
MELLSDAGFDGFAQAFRILFNESMKAERSHTLGADLHQHTDNRKGYANGYKPKTAAHPNLPNIPLAKEPTNRYPSYGQPTGTSFLRVFVNPRDANLAFAFVNLQKF